MDNEERAARLLTWKMQNPHATHLPEWATPAKKEQNEDAPILYTITTRRGKWKTALVFAVEGGILAYRGQARYQPGATAGHDHEARVVGHPFALADQWEVREIGPHL